MPVEIKEFDPNRLEELAKDQTGIYNAEIVKLVPNSFPSKVENTIKRFQKETFDKTRLFYAYEGDKMVGYLGLTGKDTEKNERGFGYPWLAEGTDSSVRDLLYNAAEKKCRDEGTKTLRQFVRKDTPEILEFFKSKDFKVIIEFLNHQKTLEHNDVTFPEGYSVRAMQKEDLKHIEEVVSPNDPTAKDPFRAADFIDFMDSDEYTPETFIVGVKDGEVVGFFGAFIPPIEKPEKGYFGGGQTHGDHQQIEPLLVQEIENRVKARGIDIMDITFYPDSPRLKPFRKMGYTQYSHSYRLEKKL